MRTLLLLIGTISLAGCVFADEPPATPTEPDTAIIQTQPVAVPDEPSAAPDGETAAPSPKEQPKSVKAKSGSEELSTELSGLDTLEVLPSDVVTRVAGGTRRVHLESTVFRREQPVEYEAAGRRDPFRALLVDEKKEGEIETDLLRLEGATLRGVVWSDGTYLALVSDKDGKSFVLREGDPVYQGRVLSVTQARATFEVSDFGDYQQIILKVRG
ncbi:MAG: hypothetical protein NT025_02340 [bacterium]|nr:hypothetical protein [bacterium]